MRRQSSRARRARVAESGYVGVRCRRMVSIGASVSRAAVVSGLRSTTADHVAVESPTTRTRRKSYPNSRPDADVSGRAASGRARGSTCGAAASARNTESKVDAAMSAVRGACVEHLVEEACTRRGERVAGTQQGATDAVRTRRGDGDERRLVCIHRPGRLLGRSIARSDAARDEGSAERKEPTRQGVHHVTERSRRPAPRAPEWRADTATTTRRRRRRRHSR
jgi:hypothetical protein